MEFMMGKATPATPGGSDSHSMTPETNMSEIKRQLADLEQRVKALEGGDEQVDDHNDNDSQSPAPEHVYKQTTPSPFGVSYKR